MMLTGREAIAVARTLGMRLSKWTDPIEGPRHGLTPDQADRIADEDPGLIYLDAAFARKEGGKA